VKFRKLRITWSVAWGVAAVLLVVLWVRSYWWGDRICGVLSQGAPSVTLMSNRGEIHFVAFQGFGNFPSGLEVASLELAKHPDEFPQLHTRLGFAFEQIPDLLLLSIPVWFVVLISGIIAAVPRLKLSNRFSVRTLLIDTALVAMALGLVVYIAR
jgi:hypothetical protein